MSRFPDSESDKPAQTQKSGYPIGGTFECNDCGKLSNEAINVRKEERLYWVCPDGHENSINFKL